MSPVNGEGTGLKSVTPGESKAVESAEPTALSGEDSAPEVPEVKGRGA